MGDLSRNFSKIELACKCGCGLLVERPRLTGLLQELRDACGAPVIINSGTRCAKHNAEVGGVANSAHLTGEAADIWIKGWPQRRLFDKIKCLHGQGKIKELRYCYPIKGSKAAVHVGVDDKPRKSVFGV